MVRGHEFNPTEDEKNFAKTHCSGEFKVRLVDVQRTAQGRGTVAVNLTAKQVLIKWAKQAGAAKMAWNKCVELDRQRRRSTPPLRELSNAELDQIVINKGGTGSELREQYPRSSLRSHQSKDSRLTVDLIGGKKCDANDRFVRFHAYTHTP